MGVSISRFAFGDIAGLTVTPYLLMSLGRWRNVFYMYGAWTMTLTAAWWTLAREPGQDTGMQLKPKARHESGSMKSLGGLLKTKQLWLLTGLYLCAGASYDTMLVWLPSVLEAEGIPPTTAGLVTSMLPLGFLFASLFVGSLSDKAGLRKPFISVLGLVCGPVIYAAGTFSAPAVWFFAFFTGFCTIGVLTLVLTIPLELSQLEQSVASAVGLISSLGNIGSFLMPSVVGEIRDVTRSFHGAVLLLAILGEFIPILGLSVAETGRKGRSFRPR